MNYPIENPKDLDYVDVSEDGDESEDGSEYDEAEEDDEVQEEDEVTCNDGNNALNAEYGTDDPPMVVGSTYSSMDIFISVIS